MGVSVGNVTIRFSVQDAEVVRKALEQLGKDGEAALRRLDTAGKPVSRTMGAVSEVVSDLRMRAQASADSLGVAGVALTRLGPAGLAAGAALGVTVGALFKVIEGVDQLADKAGRIKSYTADRLTYSPDPPACYGMIEFEEGGRVMIDFTDIDGDALKVGQPMRMMFRIKDIDANRGFRRYYWKAAPTAGKG